MKGRVEELWRYPVSSMAGEQLTVARVEAGGIACDRIWGVLDEATGRIASPGREKHFIGVPRAHAKIADGGVAVSVDGRNWTGPEDTAMRDALSKTFGFRPILKPFDAIESGGFHPRYKHAPIHLLTTAALRSLRRELPDSVIDARRFRPSILVDWQDEDQTLPENDWIGREITIGEVVLRGERPCGRCGFIILEQDRLPRDEEIMRRVVRHHDRNFGIYCDVVVPGQVTTGTTVTVA